MFDPEKVKKYNAIVELGPLRGVSAIKVVLGDEYDQLLGLYRALCRRFCIAPYAPTPEDLLEEIEAMREQAKGRKVIRADVGLIV